MPLAKDLDEWRGQRPFRRAQSLQYQFADAGEQARDRSRARIITDVLTRSARSEVPARRPRPTASSSRRGNSDEAAPREEERGVLGRKKHAPAHAGNSTRGGQTNSTFCDRHVRMGRSGAIQPACQRCNEEAERLAGRYSTASGLITDDRVDGANGQRGRRLHPHPLRRRTISHGDRR